ncbi:FAD-dependent oxidoreductase [Ktedonosporobacter rubrisoli]|uniref:FAD-dependent oxidoreductase n=1 Tax=Ktedonosporobacter rubrisoli TaxID=2509675 RepID=A0A4P6JZ94_KTERU|nr:FAD-dependent monooxygenase [Ktedonosporobacter rubrisoli]QBD81208.1 FAD-dependent oxidoreductase [Ktedonosporobacter rubrisoli]
MPSDQHTAQEHVSVLIVGGGLVGLSTSLFLAHYGIRSRLVERHSATSLHPKQFSLSIRAMELLRSVGLENAVRNAAAPLAENKDFLIVSTFAQGEMARYPLGGLREEEIQRLSPTTRGICPQDVLEPLLLEAAQKLGSELHFGCELRSFEQTPDGILATIREVATGKQKTIHADYLVVADGARSRLRQQLGIKMQSRWSSEQNISIYFHADLSNLMPEKPFFTCLVTHPEASGILLPANNRDRWIFMLTLPTGSVELEEHFTSQRCLALLRQAIGVPQLEIEVKSVLPWEAAARVAEHFSLGRAFLVGDAAHLMPPTGGFGASTGIQDAQNLAWKLALVLSKQAGPTLLATYESERRPIALFTTEQARLRWQAKAQRHAGDAAQREKLGLADEAVVMLGYQYTSPAVISPRQALPSHSEASQNLDGHPGTRAPHLWVEHQGRRISTLDLYGKGFVLLAGAQAADWRDASRHVSNRLGLDLTVYTVGLDIADIDGSWYIAHGITPQGAMLIRPDGFVAWRSASADESADRTLERVLSHLLCWVSSSEMN